MIALLSLGVAVISCKEGSKKKGGSLPVKSEAGTGGSGTYRENSDSGRSSSGDDGYNKPRSGDKDTPDNVSGKTVKCEVKYNDYAMYQCYTDGTCRDCGRLLTTNQWVCPQFTWPDARSELACGTESKASDSPTYGYTPQPGEVLPVISSKSLRCNIKYSDYALVQCYKDGTCRDCSRNNPYAVWKCPSNTWPDARSRLPCEGSSSGSGAIIYSSSESGEIPKLSGKTVKCSKKYSDYSLFQCFTDGTCRDCSKATPSSHWRCPSYSWIDGRAQMSCGDSSTIVNSNTYSKPTGSGTSVSGTPKCSKEYSDYSKYECFNNGTCRDCYRVTKRSNWICPSYAWPDGRAATGCR